MSGRIVLVGGVVLDRQGEQSAEVMIDPIGRSDLVGEWLELLNLADDETLDLADCWLSLDPTSGATGRTSLDGSGLARVGPGDAPGLGPPPAPHAHGRVP